MKKWLLILAVSAAIIAGVVAVLMWWKNRLPPATITTSYGLTVTIPSGFRSYDLSTLNFLDDSGQTYTRCPTPNTRTIDPCVDGLDIAMGLLDLTPLDVNKIQGATGVAIPEGTISFDIPWILSEGINDIASKEESAFTVSGLPATGLIITRKSSGNVEYFVRIVHPTKQIGVYVSGWGNEAQNVKAVTEVLLQSMTISDSE